MPGIAITVDTSNAVSNLDDFRKALEDSGAAANMTESEIEALEARFLKKIGADEAAESLEEMNKTLEETGEAAGKSKKEIAELNNHVNASTKAMREHASSVESAASSIASIAVKAAGAVAAFMTVREALEGVYDFMKEAVMGSARYETLGVVLKTIGQNAGYSAGYLEQLNQSLQKTGITSVAARQSLAQMISANIDLASATKLARAAQDAAVIGNVNSSEAFQRMVTAIASGQTEMLRTLGINVSFEVAYAKMADRLHTTADALTEVQKAQARTNETMVATQNISGAYEAAMGTAGKQIKSLQRYWEEFGQAVGDAFQDSLTETVKGVTEAIEKLIETVKDKEFQRTLAQMASIMAEMAKYGLKAAEMSQVKNSGTTTAEALSFAMSGDMTKEQAMKFTALKAEEYANYLRLRDTTRQKLEQQDIIEEIKKRNTTKMLNDVIMSKDYDNSKGIGDGKRHSSEGPYTSSFPEDGSFEKQYAARIANAVRNAEPEVLKATEQNRNFMDAAQALQGATEIWNGERNIAETAQKAAQAALDIARATGNKAAEEEAQKFMEKAENLEKLANQKVRINQAAIQRGELESLHAVEIQRQAAIASQAGYAGDKFGASDLAAIKQYDDTLFNLRLKLMAYNGQHAQEIEQGTKYWAAYELGVNKARIAVDKWHESMQWFGNTMQAIGHASGNSELSYLGTLTLLQDKRVEALKQNDARGGSDEEIAQRRAMIEQDYALKARDAWFSAYQNLRGISGDYFESQRERLANEVEAFRKAGADEVALRVYQSQQMEKIKAEEVQARIGSEQSFGEYVANRAAIDLGAYKGAQSRSIEEWNDYYETLKNAATSFGDTLKNGLASFVDSAVTGKAEEAWKNLMASLRRHFIQLLVDLAFDWAKHNIFKDALTNATGAGSAVQNASRPSIREAVNTVKASVQGSGQIRERDLEDFTDQKPVGLTGMRGPGAASSSRSPYEDEARKAAEWYGIDPNTFKSLIYHESRWDQGQVSSAGAIGLAQLMPDTAKTMGVDPNDPVQNVWGGAKYLALLRERYKGKLTSALNAYEAGPGNVDAGTVPQHVLNHTDAIIADSLKYQEADRIPDLSSISAPPGLHIEKLNNVFASHLGDAAKEFEETTGRKLRLSDAVRTYEQQAKLFAEKGPKWAAKPGNSMHEFFQAVDVHEGDYAAFDPIAEKHGLRYLRRTGKPDEPWHYQLAGSYGHEAEIRNGTWNPAGLESIASSRERIKTNGIVGDNPEAVQGLGAAISSHGMIGAFLGSQGAQSIVSRISTDDGLLGIFAGQTLSGKFSAQMATATPSAGSSGIAALAVMSGKGAVTQQTELLNMGGGSSDAASMYQTLLRSGFSSTEAAQVTESLYGVGSVATASGASSTSASSTTSTTQQQSSTGSNSSFSDLFKQGGGSLTSKLDQWGYDNLGIGTSSWDSGAFAGKNVSGWTNADGTSASSSISGGLGSIAGGALSGAATGYGISSLVYPNGTGTVGGTIGGAVGGALASATLGSVLGSFAGPIGGLVGGLVGSLLTGSETKKTEKTGSGVTVDMTSPGSMTQSGYSTYRTTTSGAFGSTSTSHSKAYDTVGDPELEAKFRSEFENYQNQTFRSLINLNLSAASLKNFSFPMKFDITDENASFAAKAVANYEAYLALDANGLRDEMDDVAKSGEVYVDELERIGTAYSKGAIAARAAGTSLENLSGSLSQIYQGDWFSRFADMVGGNDTAQKAFTNYIQYGMTTQTAANMMLKATGQTAGEAIAQIGDSSVNTSNFWSRYGEAIQGQLTPEQMSYWANAAQAVAQFDDAQKSSLTLMENINSVRMAQLKAEQDAMKLTKVMVDGVKTSVSSAYSTYKSLNDSLISTIQTLKWSSNLSPNTATTTFQQQQAYYNQLKTKVAGENASSLTYSSDIQKLIAFSQTYLSTARSYYGASTQYWSIYNEVTGGLQALQDSTQTELDVLQAQLIAQNEANNKIQDEIDQLTLVNENLAILGSGLDGLGSSIQAGLESLGSQMSWTPNIQAAVDAANAAQAAISASLAAAGTYTTDTSGTGSSFDWSSLIGNLGGGDPYNGSSGYSLYLGGYADGGDVAGPGWIMAGENGPEPIKIAAGTKASVTSNDDFTGSMDKQTAVTAAGLSALLDEVRGMRAELAQIRSTGQRAANAPVR